MTTGAKSLAIAFFTFALTLVVAFVGAFDVLRESAGATEGILRYVAVSAGASLIIGLVAVATGNRLLPKLSLEVAVVYAVVSVAAIITIVYTPLLMFKDPGDLHLLVLLLVCFLAISLGLGAIIAVGIARNLENLREAARKIARGDFTTKVRLRSRDELSDLATAFNRMSSELGDAFQRERAVEAGRRDLVAAISHDLRTPLSSIRIMLEAIGDGVVQDDSTIRQYHAAMGDQVKRLSHLIDDLFELSRLDCGELTFERCDVNMGELLTETVESMRPSAADRGLQLNLERTYGGNALVDPDQLQRVVVNLIQNAIQHTPSGGTIDVDLRQQDSEIAVEVRDSGVGISAEDTEHIFERFYRGEKSRTRGETNGAGLGLAIAKAIVEAHSGRIWVHRAPDRGSSFVFTLPTAQ